MAQNWTICRFVEKCWSRGWLALYIRCPSGVTEERGTFFPPSISIFWWCSGPYLPCCSQSTYICSENITCAQCIIHYVFVFIRWVRTTASVMNILSPCECATKGGPVWPSWTELVLHLFIRMLSPTPNIYAFYVLWPCYAPPNVHAMTLTFSY